MKQKHSPTFLVILLFYLSGSLYAQPWSGILDPTRATDWSQAGIPGGVPDVSWAQSGSTVLASTYGNGSSDATAGIQTALNACGMNHYVQLGAGTFRVNTHLSIPSNCVLRGSGPDQTQLNAFGSSNYVILMGSDVALSGNVPISAHTAITSGATSGSQSIVVSSASGINVGNLMVITQSTEPPEVTDVGTGGTCDWCNEGVAGSGFSGQTVIVTSVSGTTIGFRPALYTSYANNPVAFPFNYSATNAGLESLKVSGNNTGYQETIEFGAAKYCWMKNVEIDFSDGESVMIAYSVGNVIRDSFIHDAFKHYGGATDASVRLMYKSSSNLIENNIMWRLHLSVLSEWGASGNVIAYNYSDGNYHDDSFGAHSGPWNWQIEDMVDNHGAHSMFNLWEGNIGVHYEPDDLWGSSSRSTVYRSWYRGSRFNYPPYETRGALQTGNLLWEDANAMPLSPDSLATYYNIVGSFFGSAHLKSISGTINRIVSGTDPATQYQSNVCEAWGYNSNSGAAASATPFNTSFIHGVNNCITNSITWASGITQTLPPSFYLPGKPSAWWGSAPWPAIGPDVTGGNISDSVANGHVNAIPALTCFNAVTSAGTSNTGVFNANSCYVSQGGLPAPPTDLSAVVH